MTFSRFRSKYRRTISKFARASTLSIGLCPRRCLLRLIRPRLLRRPLLSLLPHPLRPQCLQSLPLPSPLPLYPRLLPPPQRLLLSPSRSSLRPPAPSPRQSSTQSILLPRRLPPLPLPLSHSHRPRNLSRQPKRSQPRISSSHRRQSSTRVVKRTRLPLLASPKTRTMKR